MHPASTALLTHMALRTAAPIQADPTACLELRRDKSARSPARPRGDITLSPTHPSTPRNPHSHTSPAVETPSLPPADPLSGEANSTIAKRNRLNSPTARWIFDPSAPTTPAPDGSSYRYSRDLHTPSATFPTNGEFSRIDDRAVTKPYRHFWQCVVDATRDYDFQKCGPPAGGLFNSLGHFEWSAEDDAAAGRDRGAPGADGEGKGEGKRERERVSDVWWAGPCSTFQEPSFIPRQGGKEGEGWLIALLNHLDVLRNDVAVFDALDVSKGPVAVIHLPLRLR